MKMEKPRSPDGVRHLDLEAAVTPKQKRKANKKRAASDSDFTSKGKGDTTDGVLVEDDFNEPTMGEKLENLNLLDNDNIRNHEKQGSPPRAELPSVDSVQVLLKQALHADDRALLLDCLYNQNEKVIANSVLLLNPADVLKLLVFLVSMIQSRGAVLACVLPWLRSLLLHHASGIMSQESSLLALKSLYQLIESRVSTLQSAIGLSSSLDFLYTDIVDDRVEVNGAIMPVIYEDESDEEEKSEDAMDTDEDIEEEETFSKASDVSDIEGSFGLSE